MNDFSDDGLVLVGMVYTATELAKDSTEEQFRAVINLLVQHVYETNYLLADLSGGTPP